MSASSRHRKTRLSIESLSLSSGAAPFSLALQEGEIISFLSEDARTLTHISDVIMGFAAPPCGRLILDGHDLLSLPPEKRPIGLVSPRAPVFDHLDVVSNIMFPLRARRASVQETRMMTDRVLALVGLNALAHRRAKTLSAEQRLRLQLGRILAYAPAIVVFDEALTGLKSHALHRTRQLIANLQRALGLTVLYMAENRDDALWLGGRIALFDTHTLMQCADAATLLDRPASELSASLFGEANVLAGRVLEIDNDIARIHLACGGIVEAMADADLESDALCTVCIRPDRMVPLFGTSIATDTEETAPLLATLHSVLHIGDQIRMRVQLTDGTEIELRRPSLQATRAATPGTSVQLAWQASQAVAFPMKDDL